MTKENLIEFYEKKLKRKENLIKEYIEEKNSIEGFKSSVNEVKYTWLYAEIELIKDFLEDLKELK